MSYLILIRHSLSHQNPAVSSHEWTLKQQGIERCGRLAEHLAPYHITHMVASPEPKARLTAEYTAQILHLPAPEIVADLQEQKRITSRYYDSVGDFEAAVMAAMQRPDEVLFGEESFTAARERLNHALHALMDASPDDTLAAVSHGTVMALWLAPLLHRPVEAVWQAMGMPAYAVIDWLQKHVLHFQATLP